MITSEGVLSFATAPNYESKTSYTATVTASDGTDTTDQSITVNVTNVNESSVTAISDTVSTDEDNSIMIDPLANDTIVSEGYEVSLQVGQPSNGTVSVNSDNTLTYSPSLNFLE